MIKNIGKHYLYRHIRLDIGEPFYIGIGTKRYKNSEYSRANIKSVRTNYWKNITNKTEYEVEILLESDDYEFIKQKEIEFIALYGRRDLGKGTLVNLTDGGDGSIGYIPSEDTIKKASNSRGTTLVNKETKIVFQTIDEASKSIGWNPSTLYNYLYWNKECPFIYEDKTLTKIAEKRSIERELSLNRRIIKNIEKTSECVGVHFDKARNRWFCQIRMDGKKVYLGRFKTQKEACDRYNEEKSKIINNLKTNPTKKI